MSDQVGKNEKKDKEKPVATQPKRETKQTEQKKTEPKKTEPQKAPKQTEAPKNTTTTTTTNTDKKPTTTQPEQTFYPDTSSSDGSNTTGSVHSIGKNNRGKDLFNEFRKRSNFSNGYGLQTDVRPNAYSFGKNYNYNKQEFSNPGRMGDLSFYDGQGVLTGGYSGLNLDNQLQAHSIKHYKTNGYRDDSLGYDNDVANSLYVGEYRKDRQKKSSDPEYIAKFDVANHYDKKYGDLTDRKKGQGKTQPSRMSTHKPGSWAEPKATKYNTTSVCDGISYPPSAWRNATNKEDAEDFVIEGVFSVKMSVKPVVPTNFYLLDNSQKMEWRITHRDQSSQVILTDFGKEVSKMQEEGIFEDLYTLPTEEAEVLFKEIKERLEKVKENDNPLIEMALSEDNQKGFSRGGVFTVTENVQYIRLTFGHSYKERSHYMCMPKIHRILNDRQEAYTNPKAIPENGLVLEDIPESKNQRESRKSKITLNGTNKVVNDLSRYGTVVLVPERVLDYVESNVRSFDENKFKVETLDWEVLRSYQLISARCSDTIKDEVIRTNGEMFQDDPFASSGKSQVVEGKEADFYNHLSVRFFYDQTACSANLKAVSNRPVEEIPERMRFFRDGQSHKIEFDPFKPQNTNNSNVVDIPDKAIYSEVAKWDQSTPKELSLFVKGSKLLTEERQEKMTGEKKGFVVESDWASEDEKPTKFMFLYDYLAKVKMKVPTRISSTNADNMKDITSTMIMTVPVSSKTREHKTVNVINMPKDLVPDTREFMEVADDQHFTIEYVKSAR